MPTFVFSLSYFFFLSIWGVHSHGQSKSDDTHVGNWMNWRGPLYNGSSQDGSSERNLPVKFDEDKGFKWKASLPGSSAATPIIFNNYVFVSSILRSRKPRIREGEACLRCVLKGIPEIFVEKEAGSGYRPVAEDGTITCLIRNQIMSPSAVTDGERVVFFFGNGDLFPTALTAKSNGGGTFRKITVIFAFQRTFSSSPTLHEGRLFLLCAAAKRKGSWTWETRFSFLLALHGSIDRQNHLAALQVFQSEERVSRVVWDDYSPRRRVDRSGWRRINRS